MGSFKNSNGVNFVSHGKEHSPTLKGNVPEVIDGKYELVRKINSGGMGDIYEAKHKILSKKVAIKFLKPELLDKKEIIERFYNEAKIAASLSTYNVVDVLDIGFHKEIPYIIMEFLEGITLEEYLKQCIPFDLKSAVKFISPVCKTIDKIHAKGIIHRDLKPSNLMIVKKEDREIVKILDFGISLFKTGSAYKRLTMTGAVLGTPSYMSPEQAMGKKEIDYRTDIYSLGAILYEMFTLRPPFEGDNYNQIITTIITQDITNPKNLNPSLDDSVCAVLLKAMAKDPEQRYRTSTEISEELNAILQKMPSEKGKSIQTPVSSIILPEAKVSAKTNEGVKTIPIVSYPTQEKEEKLQEKASKSSNWLAKSAIITGTLLVIIIGGFLIFNSIITKSTIKKKNNEENRVFNKADLDHFVNIVSQGELKNESERENIKIFQKALDFSNVKVRECMIPRTDIEAIEIGTGIDELRQRFIETRFSRILVYTDTIDQIAGYVELKDIFKNPPDISSILRKLVIVPETMPANRLLKLFIDEKVNIAIVVDEFGGTSGLVTIEDVVEEIVGDIEDEHDVYELVEKQIGKNEFIFSGRLEIDYLNEKYSLNLPEKDDYETLAGMVLYYHESIPKNNDIVKINNIVIKVLKATATRIDLLNLKVEKD